MTADAAAAYSPMNPGFYWHAVARIRASLVPNIQHASDGDGAETAAKHCAALLDSGATPRGYEAPKIAKIMHAILATEVLGAAASNSEPGKILPYAQSVASAHHNTAHSAASVGPEGKVTGFVVDTGAARSVPLTAPVMNEDQKRREKERLESLAKEFGGKIPTREEAAAINRAALDKFLDISEAVRSTALDCTCTHLSQRPHITGATAKDALDIAVYELDCVIRLFTEGGIPTRAASSLSDEERLEFGVYEYPYPVYMLALAYAEREADIAAAAMGGESSPAAAAESTMDSEDE